MARIFGQKLRELRLAKKMTMRKFAEEVGFTAPHLCDIEWGRRNPPGPEIIKKMCVILDANRDELFKLAQEDRGKADIAVDQKPIYVRDVAFALQRAIFEDDIDEETATRISGILNEKTRTRVP